MANVIWVVVMLLIVAWLLTLGGMFLASMPVVWATLSVAIMLAMVAFMTADNRE